MGNTDEMVSVISKNGRTKLAQKREPQPPFFNNDYFRGQTRAKVGASMVVVRLPDARGKKTSVTLHCFEGK